MNLTGMDIGRNYKELKREAEMLKKNDMGNREGEIKKVDLGCGDAKKDSQWVGVDILDTDCVDVVQDLDEESWDLPSNHFDIVKVKDVFEHLENPVNFLEEVHRICKDGALVYINSPHLSSNNWVDPTHRRLVGRDTIKNYFSNEGHYSYYSDARFNELNVKICFETSRKIFFYNKLVEWLVNVNNYTQWFYEKTFLSRLFPAASVQFYLEVVD